MNDKLQDLLEGIQRTAVQAGDVVSDAAYGVGKTTSRLLSTAKLNIRICELKADINVAFRELGEMLYATHTGNPTDSEDLLHKLEEIDALKAQLSALSAQLGRAEAAACCPVCGAASRTGDAFCRECGSALNREPAPQEETPAAEAEPADEPVTEEDFAD